jgi:hypothetical protein
MSTNSNQTGDGGVRGAKLAGYPDFGRAMLKDFQFEDGCMSLLWLY